MTEAEKEAREAATVYIHEMRPEWHDRGVGIVQGSHYRKGFVAGAAWQASRAPQPTEAEWSCEQGCKAPSAVCLLDHRPAPQPTEDGYVVPCARCGVRKVITRTPLNDDLDVCGDCGVQIGLTELQPQPTEDEPLNIERENAAADYVRRWARHEMKPEMTVGERVHDAFVSGAEWAAGLRRAPAEPAELAVTDEMDHYTNPDDPFWQSRPEPIPSREHAVTDEMVERAAKAWASGSPTPNNWENMAPRLQDITKGRMRTALEAALSTERNE